jgi:hypothetical protein
MNCLFEHLEKFFAEASEADVEYADIMPNSVIQSLQPDFVN